MVNAYGALTIVSHAVRSVLHFLKLFKMCLQDLKLHIQLIFLLESATLEDKKKGIESLENITVIVLIFPRSSGFQRY